MAPNKPRITGDHPVEIEPLTPKELKEQGKTTPVWESPEYPKEWIDNGLAPVITDLVGKGWKYYKRRQGERMYMLLRKGDKDRGLGAWTEEKEGKLFSFYPSLETMGKIEKPAPWTPQGVAPPKSYLAVPIARVAIIPRDYVPTINVIRYFELVKEQGFEGTFSDFINDMVTHHLRDCHGITLPYMFRADQPMEIDEEMRKQLEVEEDVEGAGNP